MYARTGPGTESPRELGIFGTNQSAIIQRVYSAGEALKSYHKTALVNDLDNACHLLGHDPVLQVPENPNTGTEKASKHLSILYKALSGDALNPNTCRSVLLWMQCLHETCRYHLSHSPEIGGHMWHAVSGTVEGIVDMLRASGNSVWADEFSILQQRMIISYGPSSSQVEMKTGNIDQQLKKLSNALESIRSYSEDGRISKDQLESAATAAETNTLLTLLIWLWRHEKTHHQYAHYKGQAWWLAQNISKVQDLWDGDWKALIEHTDVETCEVAELDLIENILRHFPPTNISTAARESIGVSAIKRLRQPVPGPVSSLLMRLAIVSLQWAVSDRRRRKQSLHVEPLATIEFLLAGKQEAKPTGIAYIRLLALRALFSALTLPKKSPIPKSILDDLFHLVQAAGGVTRDTGKQTVEEQAKTVMQMWHGLPYASQREDLAETVERIAQEVVGPSGMILVLQHSQSRITNMMENIAENISAKRSESEQITTESLEEDFQEVEKTICAALEEISQAYFDGYCSLSLDTIESAEQKNLRHWHPVAGDEKAHYYLPINCRNPVNGKDICILARADISALQYLIPIFRSLKSQKVFDILSSQLSELIAYRRERFEDNTGALKEEKAEKLARKRGFIGNPSTFWITNLDAILSSRSVTDRPTVRKEILEHLYARVIVECEHIGILREDFIVGMGSVMTIYPRTPEIAEKVAQSVGSIRASIRKIIHIPHSQNSYRLEPDIITTGDEESSGVRSIREMHDTVQKALAENRIRIFLQPIRSITDHKRAERFEALLRIVDKEWKLMKVNIEEMIKVAWALGRIEDISYFVVTSCFELLRANAGLQLSCNLRLDDFQDSAIARAFEQNRDICPRLIVEISERESGDDVDERALALQEEHGFVLALDDYGKEKSSFGRKSGTILKFDKDYVRKNIFPADLSNVRAQELRRDAVRQIHLDIRNCRSSWANKVDRRIVIEWLETIEEVTTLQNLIMEEGNPHGKASDARRLALDLPRYLYYQGFAEEGRPGPAEEILTRFHIWKYADEVSNIL